MRNRASRPKAREQHQHHWPILASALSAISHLQLYGWADMGRKWRTATERANLNHRHCTTGWEKVEIHGCVKWDAEYQSKGKLLSCPISMWTSQMWEEESPPPSGPEMTSVWNSRLQREDSKLGPLPSPQWQQWQHYQDTYSSASRVTELFWFNVRQEI